MNSIRRPRITIADLPPLEPLTPEEMALILGAGNRNYQPAIEALEDRQVPTATPTTIASALTHSQENYTNTVNQAYEQYLGRPPDSAGQAYWVAGLQNGLRDEQLQAGFIGSPEYIADHGGSGAGWVRGMYQNLLSRTPSNDEVNYWLNQLNQGVSPTSVAYGFAASAEREGDLVAADYQKYLGRTPSQNEIAYWVNAFEQGQTNEDLIAGFVGSAEFFSKAGGNTNPALWLESAYRDILGRMPSNQECLSWVGTVAGPSAGVLMPPTAVVGQPLHQVAVFHFDDADPLAQANTFAVNVQTGDGTWLSNTANPQNVQVVAKGIGGFDVHFSYTYANALTGSTFAVLVTDANGVSISAQVDNFAINSPPLLTSQPSSQTTTAGNAATFAASASGTPTPTVQWQVSSDNGVTFTNVPGATAPTLSFTPTTAQNGNQYEAVFSNAASSVTSNAVTLTVNSPPLLTIQPGNQAVLAGNAATFTAAARGTPTPTVQWQVSTDNGTTFTNVSGATSTTLIVTPTAAQNGNRYQAVFTNIVGSVISSPVTLTFSSAPVLTNQPSNQTTTASHAVTFTASANGTPAPTVQWQVSTNDGVTFTNIPGATSPTLVVTGTAAQNGYLYQAVFTNSAGSVSSSAATLTIDSTPGMAIQPSNQTAIAGSAATFIAVASGTPAPTVQWQVSSDNGTTFDNVPGAISATLTFTPSAAQNGYLYEAVFTNSAGSVTSSAVTLTVNIAPVVLTQASNQAVIAGNAVTFTTAASGTPTPTVQWQVSTNNGLTYTNVPGATAPTFTLTPTTAQSGDQYEVVFSNAADSVTSDAVTLTVNSVPVISTQPSHQIATAGNSVTILAVANGTPTPTVQWQVSTDNGVTYTNIPGATTPTLTLTPTAAQSGNQYEAVFSNAVGNVTSNAATLTVNSAPTVTTQPGNQAVIASNAATFTASANGTPAPTVQWQVSTNDGVTFTNIPGATSPTLVVTGTAAQNGHQYQAVFTNSAGSVSSIPATLTIDSTPGMAIQPSNQTAIAGSAATFIAVASGTPAPTVQWQVSSDNGTTYTNIPGATSTTLTFTPSAAQNGSKYHAVFANAAGSILSSAATLTVNSAPVVATQPGNQTTIVGHPVTFTATASGTPVAAVQWQVSSDNGITFTNIPGATTPTLTFTGTVAQNGYQYEAVFTNYIGSATSSPATLTVGSLPVLTSQPLSQTTSVGNSVMLGAAANGTPPPTVQWQVSTNNGVTFTNVPGATSPTLTFLSIATQSGNQYQAVFSNSVGSVTSNAIILTVNSPPLLTIQPGNQAVIAGNAATLTAAASGTPTPTVQWQVSSNGGTTYTNIPGATSPTLMVTPAQSGNLYEAIFTNPLGSATSSAATVMVSTVPVVTTQPSDQTTTVGNAVTLTATANGTPTPTVQWQVSVYGGTYTNVPGATAPTLTFTPTAAQNGNLFQAIFTNSAGSVTSSAATLTVNSAPVVLTQPSNQAIIAGNSATFTASASGTPTPTIQWQVSTDNGTIWSNVPDATSPTLTLNNLTPAQSGYQYEAVFTNTLGSAGSSPAFLTVSSAPVLTSQPSNQTTTVGNAVTFTASADGTPAPSVQWQVSTNNGVTFTNIPGATAPTLTVTSTVAQSGYQYQAVYANSAGSVTSSAATLTVNSPPVVTTQPANRTLPLGGAVTFTAAAQAAPAATVQWQVSTNNGATWSNLANATALSLTFTPQLSNSGDSYRAVFSNAVGTVVTNQAVLTLLQLPAILGQPQKQTFTSGQSVTFTAAANGLPSPTVQWQVSSNNGTTWNNVAGAVSAKFLWQPTLADFGNLYRAVFSNTAGQAITNSVTLLAASTTSGQQAAVNATAIATALANTNHDNDQHVASILCRAGVDATAIASALTSVFNDNDQEAANVLVLANVPATNIAAALAKVYSDNDQQVANVLFQAGVAATDITTALVNVFNDTNQQASAIVTALQTAAQQDADDTAAQQAAAAAAEQAAEDAAAQQAAQEAADEAAAQQAAANLAAEQAAADAAAQQAAADLAAQQAAEVAAQQATNAAAQQAAEQAAADAAAQLAADEAAQEAAQQAANDAAAQQAAANAAAQQAAQQAAAQQAAADAAAQQAADAAAQAAAAAAAQQAAQQAAADAAAQQAAADAAAQQAADAAAQAAADAAAQQAAADAAAQQAAADAAAQQAAADAAAQQAAADAAAQQDGD